ncbi:SGNH/GDSL hydrolase family protein [Arthrobacter sp. AD-310]
MGTTGLRRRYPAFAAGLAALALTLGFTAAPAGAAPPRDVDYVALGDSYTAGTGAGGAERPAGVDCWQNPGGYVDLAAKVGSVNLTGNAACHGAVLSTASPTYDPVLYTPTVQEQLALLAGSGALSTDTELVSITAGANDLGFAYVLGVCAFADEATCRATVSAATSQAALTFLKSSLIQTYDAIQAAAPNAKVVVLGYPLLFDPASQFAPIPVANQVLMNEATLTVNAAIAEAAALAGVQYVDVTKRFAGHEVNSSDPWLQLDLANFAADYNFHPTPDGHRAYAAALLAAARPGVLARP